MKKSKILFILSLVCLSFSISSCYYDKKVQEEIINLPETISYANDIQPLWNTNCISCHPEDSEPDLRAANSYDAIMGRWIKAGNASESSLYKSLIGEAVIMPPSGKMSQYDINLVEKWINDGALNN